MATTNDVTGDSLITPSPSQEYRDNYDRIFGRPKRDLETSNEGEDIADSAGESDESGSTATGS